MLRNQIICLLGLFFVSHTTFFGQRNIKYKFENLTIEDGLSQSQINDITQDQKHFIWIATQDGLNRYDGYEFKVFKNNVDSENSLNSNYIFSILSVDQELWISTDKGLNVMDLKKGTTKSFFFDPLDENSLANNLTRKLFLDKDSNLWIGSSNGKITKYDREKERFTRYLNLPISTEITGFAQDSRANIWISTSGNGIIIINSLGKIVYSINTLELGLAAGVKSLVINERLNQVWLGSNSGLSIISYPKNFKDYKPEVIYSKPSFNEIPIIVNAILHDSKNKYWIGTNGKGLARVILNPKTGIPESFIFSTNTVSERYSLTNNIVYSLFEDSSGIIWVGTSNGLSKFSPSKQYFDHINGFTSNTSSTNVWAILEDNKGDVWVGTRQGVAKFNRYLNECKTYTELSKSPNYGSNKSIYSLLEDRSGNLWAGTVDQLLKIERNSKNEITKVHEIFHWGSKADEYIENTIYRIFQAENGDIYFGTKYGIGIYKPKERKYSFVSQVFSKDSLPLPSLSYVRCIEQDKDNNIWLGTESGLFKVENYDFTSVNYYGNEISGFNDRITSLFINEDNIWVGTYGKGLVQFIPEANFIQRYSEQNGLPNNVIYGILSDHNSNLWLSTNKGLCMFNIKKQSFTTYTEEDGLQSNEFNVGAYAKGRNNHMYFGGINGFNIFNPRNIIINTIPPVPVVTDIKLYNRSINHNPLYLENDVTYVNALDFNHRQNNITIEYAGLHYLSSSKNTYMYKLSGFDEDWIHTPLRYAMYNNLEPGDYTFLLKACNSDGLCNQVPLEFQIQIKPAVWQQWWFRISALLFIAGLVILVIKARFAIIENQKQALAILVQRRTKEVLRQKEKIEQQKIELERQKKKADDLLKNMLPQQTVEELQHKGRARARSFKMATVMFTDFKNFTTIAEQLQPRDLLDELDKYFKKFDEIIEKHNLEKIKTIGDSYMCVGGIPVRNRTNPYDVVLAALEIQDFMEQLKQKKAEKGEQFWEIRIGIHTGSLIAGVIGTKRLAYDIWGDTVNVANRLETTCLEGRINISGKTYEHIKDYFDCTYRGKIKAKNKGEIDMYFVDGLKAEYSRGKSGRIPNAKLKRKIDELIFGYTLNYKKAEKNLIRKLRMELPENLFYHSVEHTIDVCAASERIATEEGLKKEDIIIIKTAALYHDAGFIKQYKNNETIGVEMAQNDLPQFGYTKNQIDTISNLILATSMPAQPQNIFQKIICDADLDYLGRDDFFEISEKLKQEYIDRGIIQNDLQWDELQIKFLGNHKYFTECAQATREWKKHQNLNAIKKRYEVLKKTYD